MKPQSCPSACCDTQCASVKLTRRDMVAATGLGVSGSLLPTLVAAAAPQTDRPYPAVKVADLSSLKTDVPIFFTYPDESSPAVLIRLREAAAQGVGPGNTVVAFSQLCTHKGCPVNYRPERKLMICPCHWSTFDPTKSGQMVIGQASQALPQIQLRVDGNAIMAIGVNGLIFGRHTNVL